MEELEGKDIQLGEITQEKLNSLEKNFTKKNGEWVCPEW